MEPVFTAATTIVDRTQPSLDGGLFTFVLSNFVHVLLSNEPDTKFIQKTTVADHVVSTFTRTGYALAIAFGIIWCILLILAAICVCCRRRGKKNHAAELILLSDADTTVSEAHAGFLRTTDSKQYGKLLQQRRERLQSHWICLAVQFFLFIVLVILLGTAVLLGFAISSQLHANLASAPNHEEAVGRLLNPAELEHTDPPNTHVFPRVLRAFAQVRAYLDEFVFHTKNHTAPIVNELIEATEQMQERMTTEFNAILFEKIGVSESFELGDVLGSSVISLIRHSMAIVEQDSIFKNHLDRFKIELQTWLRLINTLSPDPKTDQCDSHCETLRSTFVSNLTIRPDTFMPAFTFAIALKFVTTDQNQTAESVQEQLNRGKILAAKQLMETKKIMAERINIPKSIGDMINKQWEKLGVQMSKTVDAMDQVASSLTRIIAPKISSGSGIALTLGCIFWSVLLLFTLGVTWLVIHYHCVPSELNSKDRRRVRAAAGVSLMLLALCMGLATSFFLVGGYLFTEACRYLHPEQKQVTVVRHDTLKDVYTQQQVFPLDSHINVFINQHWSGIAQFVKKSAPEGEKPMPIPHIRSPIYAVTSGCREDRGILDALDAIRDFDTASLNDPEMSARFVEIGRQIMLDSLKAIDVNEMFPKETDEQLALASRMDDFIVNFEQIRSKLPSTYLSVHSADEESGSYRSFHEEELWSSWDAYQMSVLLPYLTLEQTTRLNAAAGQVRARLANMTVVITTINNHLKQLSDAKKVGPVVLQLQSSLVKLKAIMSDKSALVQQANLLFNEHVAAKTSGEAAKLVAHFGPKLMTRVGRCRRLYEATADVNVALCGGVVDLLNGLWFVFGWLTLIGTLIITFGLSLLLHKPPTEGTGKLLTLAHSSVRSFSNQRNRNKISSDLDASDLETQAELEQLTVPEQGIGPLRMSPDITTQP